MLLRFISLILLLSLTNIASAQSLHTNPCVTAGSVVKCFPSTGIFLNNNRTLRLGTNDATHYVELAAPNGVGTSYTWTWPTANATTDNSVLSSLATGTLSWQAPGQIVGTTTNDTASTGNVGEYIERLRGSNLNITSTQAGHALDVDSAATISGSTTTGASGITLTAGTWDISGMVGFSGNNALTVSLVECWVGDTAGDSTSGRDLIRNWSEFYYGTVSVTLNNTVTQTTPTWRVKIANATTNTYYLKALVSGISGGSMDLTGSLRATRIR